MPTHIVFKVSEKNDKKNSHWERYRSHAARNKWYSISAYRSEFTTKSGDDEGAVSWVAELF
jgi:hypothetical protein